MNYRGALHVHSTYSYDGKLSLVELKKLFQEKGISFVCMTEHTDALDEAQAERFIKECRMLSDASFICIPGFEVPYGDAHILMIGCDRFLGQRADEEMLLRFASASRLTVLAHPVRNRFRIDQTLRGILDGVEIWNGQYDGIRVPRARSAHLYETLLSHRPQLLRTAGLDFHREEHIHGPIVEIETSLLSEEKVLALLGIGAYRFGGIPARGSWTISLRDAFVSVISTTLVALGKKVNALLAAIHLPLPKKLRRRIRAYL